MKLYIAIWKDRHSDTTAHPFSDQNKAIEWARAKAKEYCRYEDDYEEHDCSKLGDWVFYVSYSCEGDCIYVATTELDGSR